VGAELKEISFVVAQSISVEGVDDRRLIEKR
jgi:hypothetical protein